jgi:hypothetical protein
MALNGKVNKEKLLQALPEIRYEKGKEAQRNFLEKMSMDRALLALLRIDHEHEYALCRSLAEHILGSVPEPDEIDIDDEE